MIRLILWNLFVFSIPFLITIAWSRFVQARQPKEIEKRGWAQATVLGVVLVIIGLVALRQNSGSAPDKQYVAPQYKDGKVISGHFE